MAIDIAQGRIGDGPVVPEMGAETQQAPQVQPNNAAAFAQPNYTQSPTTSLLNVMSRFVGNNALSPAGTAYVQALQQGLKDPTAVGYQEFVIKHLNKPANTLAIIANQTAIVLLFSEACAVDPRLATISLEEQASLSLREQVPGCDLLSVLVVTPEDYNRVGIMVNDIKNTFLGGTTDADLDVSNSILRNAFISFSDDRVEYEKFVAAFDPHGVPVRADLTLTLYVSDREQRNPQWNERSQYFQNDFSSRQVLGAVGAYVEWARDSERYCFMPILHISYMNSCIKSEKMIPILLTAAIKRFLMTRAWWMQYDPSNLNGGRQITNLGALIPDETSPTGRWILDTPQKMLQFRETAMVRVPGVNGIGDNIPVVLDITEGRTKLPGLEMFADAAANVDIINSLNSFLGAAVFRPEDIAASKQESVYSGFFPVGQQKLSTEYIDFLSEYGRRPTEATKFELLCFKRIDPTQKLNEMKEIEPDAQFHYRTDYALLTPAIMVALVNQLGILNQASFGANSPFSLANYQINGAQWAAAQQNIMGPCAMMGTFNPIQPIYNYK